MTYKWIILFGCLLFASILSAENGWQSLFNGKDLKNWQVLNGEGEFKVENDVIVAVSRMGIPNTFLATKKSYGDFILEYDVQIDAGLNSGVQIRSQSLPEYQNGRVHGYQVEVDPTPRAWTGGIYDEARRGWLYNLECNPKAKTAFKPEDWNHFRVEAIGNQIRVWLNGTPSADIVDDMTPKGFIALQSHAIYSEKDAGKKVRFRNIRIRTDRLESEMLPISQEIPQISYLNNTLTEREKKEGWRLLWDGATTSGWRGARLDRFPEQGWKIADGTLTVLQSGGGEARGGGDIVTVRTFRDFELEVDFRITQAANSGIKYFVDTELNQGEGSSIGCEYQILDDKLHPDAKLGTAGNRTLASLYDLIPADAHFYAPNESTAKRVNEYGWNRAKITVGGSHVEHWLNGIKVVEYDRGTQAWRALVARSKYSVWPAFGELEQGHILLQDHGNEVSFRNIKIRETNP